MLTPKQIKNLKPGDPLIIHGTFARMSGKGDIVCCVKSTDILGEVINEFKYIHPSCVSLPTDSQSTATAQLLRSRDGSTVNSQSKYDPTRLFKEGDWVRIVKHQGRKFNAAPPAFQLGKTYIVSEDENTEHCYVMLQSCDLHYAHPVAFLELVTPVEASEPFGVRYNTDRDCAEVYHRHYKNTVAAFYCKCGITREQAEEHAEAECKRLNEEYRKNQNNE